MPVVIETAKVFDAEVKANKKNLHHERSTAFRMANGFFAETINKEGNDPEQIDLWREALERTHKGDWRPLSICLISASIITHGTIEPDDNNFDAKMKTAIRYKELSQTISPAVCSIDEVRRNMVFQRRASTKSV